MSESIISTWSPSDLILPTVDSDTKYAAYFVTENGSIDGLNLTFNQGDWLIYIVKDGGANWYRANGGITVFNTTAHTNMPDPGTYTRVRLDNNGNIILADYLEKDDLPKHTHDVSDITSGLEAKIRSVVGAMLSNQANGTVLLKYDDDTSTISADINIDDETITKGDFGELIAKSGSSSDTGTTNIDTSSISIKIENVDNLSDRLSAIEASVQKNYIIVNNSSGLEKEETKDGTVLKVKADGTSIVLNEFGELSLGSGTVSDSTTTSNNHTHTSSQITDFEEAVKLLISKNAAGAVSVTSIPIDGSSIIINKNGTLSCVSTDMKAHTHVMNDITDLNQSKANVWASDQNLVGDYSSGYQDLTNKSIGYAVSALNIAAGTLREDVNGLLESFGKLTVPEPPTIEVSTTTVTYVGKEDVYDRETLGYSLEAGSSAILDTDLFYPANKGNMAVIIDGSQADYIEFNETTKLIKNGRFCMTSMMDSYNSIPIYKGYYKSMTMQYNVSSLNLKEGYHTIQWKHTYDGISHLSPETTFLIYTNSTPEIFLDDVTTPENNSWVSGVPCYKGDGKFSFTPTVYFACSSRFIPKKLLSYTFNSETAVELIPLSISSTFTATFEKQTLVIPSGYTGMGELNFTAYTCNGDAVSHKKVTLPSLMWNSSGDIESYRIAPVRTIDTENPKDIICAYRVYDSYTPIPEYEMFIKDSIGTYVKTDYTRFGGANYSTYIKDKYGYLWINLRMEAPFMNNLHLNIIKPNNINFSKQINGTLEGIEIFVAQTSTDTPNIWVNGNSPYLGYGSASGKDFSGLDLFKSTVDTRYITFGQRPEIDSGYLYVKIGSKYEINLEAVVASMKESINEWS